MLLVWGSYFENHRSRPVMVKAKRQWHNKKCLEEITANLKFIHLIKLFFKKKGETKTLSEEYKWNLAPTDPHQ